MFMRERHTTHPGAGQEEVAQNRNFYTQESIAGIHSQATLMETERWRRTAGMSLQVTDSRDMTFLPDRQ